MKQYIAYLQKESDTDFGVSFPDFPGCVTAGETLAEAHQMAAEALELHIEGMLADGEAIPEPSNLDHLSADPDLRNAVAILVSITLPTKTVRFNVSALDSELALIDRAAKKAGMNRSEFMICRALG